MSSIMNPSEDVFTVNINNPPSYTRRQQRQQNGDIFSSSSHSRATMESIGSLHENPFYKNFGIRHNARPRPRSETRLSSNGRAASDDDDDIGEYRPGSGFVHKLMDKFSSLTAKEEPPLPISHFKKSSSLEELSVENESKPKPAVTAKDSNHTGLYTRTTKPSYLSATNLAHRARSIESLNHVHRKPHHHHNLAVPLRHVEPRWDKDRSSVPLKSPRDSHVEAPDVELAREDIILIENTPSFPETKDSSYEESESDDGSQVLSAREPFLKDELPKPNTVVSVRSIFENASSSSSSGGGLSSRRLKPDLSLSQSPLSPTAALSPSQTEATQVSPFASSHDSNRVSIRTPSPITSPRIISHDTYAKPVLLPSSATISKPFDYTRRTSESSYSNNSSTSVTSYSRPLVSPRENTPRSDNSSSDSSSVSASADNKQSKFERSSITETNRLSDSFRPTPSPRSTASVKPTILNKPSVPLRPVPLSAPASAATSYKRSSPVVPVAPYKDKLEDTKDDGQPVMIFSKAKLSPRREKPQRTKDYSSLNDSQKTVDKEEVEMEKDIIIPREAKKKFESEGTETNNKVLSQRKNIFTSNNKAADKSTPDQNNIVHTKHHTTIELKKPAKPPFEREKAVVTEKLKEAEKAIDLKPVRAVAASRPTTNVTPSIRRQAPNPPRTAAQLKPQSMIYISSSENSESDATPPETPRTRPPEPEPMDTSPSTRSGGDSQPETPRDKPSAPKHIPPMKEKETLNDKPVSKISKTKQDSQDQPIKGIPSIIAQRMKKNTDPSQVADNVVSSSGVADSTTQRVRPMEEETSTDSEATSPRVRLTPVTSSSSSSSDNTKDSLSSEIENEIMRVRKRMEGNHSKSSGATPIFDSSQLAKKRKKNQQQGSAGSQGVVPKLDLSSITNDRSMEYQPVQKVIKPCNIVFIGENAKTERSLLTKKRKIKVSIHFNDAKTETFEYPNEEWALEKYLEDHPHEAADILVLEEFGGMGESSDDVETVDIIETPVTPRGNNDEDLLKSNTALSHSGSLQSYRGRFQQEYEFGAVLKEPEKPKAAPTEPTVSQESLMLRPAEEEDSNTWSTNSSSDLLF